MQSWNKCCLIFEPECLVISTHRWFSLLLCPALLGSGAPSHNSACYVHWPFNFWINKLEIKSLKFHAAKKAAVTRPGEYVNKAIWGPRWFPSVQGSWICPPVRNSRQVGNDDDDVPWIHLDSLIQEKKQHLVRWAGQIYNAMHSNTQIP